MQAEGTLHSCLVSRPLLQALGDKDEESTNPLARGSVGADEWFGAGERPGIAPVQWREPRQVLGLLKLQQAQFVIGLE